MGTLGVMGTTPTVVFDFITGTVTSPQKPVPTQPTATAAK